MTNLERLLLAADDSANGKFASRLAGVIAGSGGKPTTIVDMSKEDRGQEESRRQRRTAKRRRKRSRKEAVKTAAEGIDHTGSSSRRGEAGQCRRDRAVRTSRTGPQAIADEARKGYDFMVVGIAKTRNPNGGFSKDISLITNGFEGPLAVVDARERRRDRLPRRHGKILIPGERHRGVAPRRRNRFDAGAGERCASHRALRHARQRRRQDAIARRASAQRGRSERAVLKDIGALADRYDVDVRSTTLVNLAPDGSDRQRSQARLRLDRARRQPAARRDPVFRQYRRVGARTFQHTSNLFVAS